MMSSCDYAKFRFYHSIQTAYPFSIGEGAKIENCSFRKCRKKITCLENIPGLSLQIPVKISYVKDVQFSVQKL